MTLIETLQKIQKARKELQGLIERAAIIFIDMAESTDYKAEKGIELGVEKAVNFNLDVSQIIKVRGEEYKQKGEIERYEISKYIGDEVMAYFKGKESVKTAIEISIEIQRHFKKINLEKRDEVERYKPKIGIDFGEVLFAEYYENSPLDPHGLVVDRAARIVSLSKPRQILISEDIKNLVEDKISIDISQMEVRRFKGIKEEVKIYEVIWDKEVGQLGIKFEEEPSAFMIPANEPTVFRFIEENNLLERSRQIDLFLYTYETLAFALRDRLLQLPTPIAFRCIIRNPLKDLRKESYITSSIGMMAGVMRENPKISFGVRFYDNEPLLRTYIFHKENNETESLLSLYRWDPASSREHHFVGAEHNYLIHTRGRSFFEEHLLNLFQSRFNYSWNMLTERKAIIFDLDGVLIDSIPFYYQAWSKAFRKVNINISKEEVYEREGEKREVTVREIYKKYKGIEPTSDLIDVIIKTKDEVYKKIFKVQIFPGVLELLTSLKDKNVKLGIVTGSTSLADKFQQQKDFLYQFDAIVTGEDTKNGKPAPDPYLIALQKLGISTKNCYVVENAPLGIKSAVRSNLTCFAVKGTSPLSEEALKEAGAHFVYKNMEELKKHLVWVDTNMHMKDFLDIFEHVL